MESFHPLSLLKPSIRGWCIRGRVVRTFLVSLVPSSKVMGLILAEEHGMTIEATVGYKMSDHYKDFINEGEWVTITNFGVVENSGSVRATTHSFKIGFFVDIVVRLTSPLPAIPHYRLASFSSIIDDEIDKSVLVDLVGAIYDVGELINTRPKQNNVDDLTLIFKISDNENRVLECLATKKEALDFDHNYRRYGGGVIVAVLGWWKIDRYFDGPKNVRVCTAGTISTVFPDPDIPESNEIHEI
ncbi:AT4g07310 [Arabidopsis thaliana]|uniref:AT4g07310 protein n=1 Tax=Arabidopsis thaliana TaxID=3702 RepID=Q9S9Y1_ARATH|nr:contains similarity to Arabidopsis thaliana hypothetical proteins; see GB:AF058826 [Arabidopsis thaliana]CAB81101.1 AT4g07310 [Arabidopsis thaliana]